MASTLSVGTSWMLVQMRVTCHKVRKWLGNQFYFSKATICIRGLVFSHGVVNRAIVILLITYLTDNWTTEKLDMAAFVVNVQYGITWVMVIALAHISDTHNSRYKMIVSTNAAYVLGLLLLWISSKFWSEYSAEVYYGAVALIALGEAGRWATLQEFMNDQYFSEQEQTPSPDEDHFTRLETRLGALWSHPWLLGAVVSSFITNIPWTRMFLSSATMLGASNLVFLLGNRWYFVRSRIDESTWQSRLEYNKNLATLFPVQQQRGEIQRKKFWPLIKVKEKWFIVELMAMCSVFLAYSMVDAAGSTFFLEQTSNLDDKVGSFTVKPLYFTLVTSVSRVSVSHLYELLVPKQHWQKATLARIGSGLVCSMLCCVAAWQVEGNRLEFVNASNGTSFACNGTSIAFNACNDTSEATSMSIMWLVPQFCLLGLMRGLAVDGLTNFLADRIVNEDRLRAWYYAAHITDFVIGVGYIITAISILAFRGIWFFENINRSRLDKVYKRLTFLCLINVICYVCIFFYLYCNKKSQDSADGEKNDEQTAVEEEPGRNDNDNENGNNEVLDPEGGADNEDEQTAVEEEPEHNDNGNENGNKKSQNSADGENEEITEIIVDG